MSVEQKPCQSHGVRSRAVVSSDTIDTFPETHHLSCNTFPSTVPIFLLDLGNMNQLHEEVQLHTESNLNTDHHTKILVESSYENKLAAFNEYKVNQNSICWDSISKSNLVQLVPAIHSSNSVPSMMAAISPTMVSIKQKHQLDVIESPTVPLNKNDDEKQTDNLDCSICGRKFVYRLNFTKHLASSGCCQPPCKKSRQEPVTNDAFKSNTLPRASRSKKVTRSNSIKSKKRQIPSSNNHKQNCQLDFDATAQFHGKSLIMATSYDFQTTPSFSLTTTSESRIQLGILMYCDFCQIQYSHENIFQRHRLAHALVIQLTRCLQLSLINNTQLYDSNISNYPAVQEWLVDQVRVNFNDQNWLIQAVREVELILNCSNMDVDIRERHGLADDNEFQKILDLLMTQELNLVSKPVCRSEADGAINFNPEAGVFTLSSVESSETSTSFTYDSSPAGPDSLSDALDTLANLPDESKVLPDMATEAVLDGEAESSVNNLDQLNDSLFVDLNAVEKQMADLFKPYQFSCSECGRCFSQQELVFEHMFLDHPIDKNHLRHEITELSEAKKELNGSTISETLPFTDIGDFLTCALNQNYQ